jgi:serine/threonine protein kinase
MCTGQLPWTKRNQAQLFEQIRRGDYVIPSYLSPECQDLISKLLCVDWRKRISVEEALEHPFMTNNGQCHWEIKPMTIVSLRRVDEFFDDGQWAAEEDADTFTELESIVRDCSSSAFRFGKLAKLLIATANVPPATKKVRLPAVAIGKAKGSRLFGDDGKPVGQARSRLSSKGSSMLPHSFGLGAFSGRQPIIPFGAKNNAGPRIQKVKYRYRAPL